MKINLIVDSNIEEEIIIKVKKDDLDVKKIIDYIKNLDVKKQELVVYKDDEKYLLNINSIIFFETQNEVVYAHQNIEEFITRNRLYELEKILPRNFIRISKSTILNLNYLTSIRKTLGTPSVISLKNTSKEVYVSRNYTKLLKDVLKERTLL